MERSILSHQTKMARLRFPGRPGLRFDRLGVRYGAEEAKNRLDTSTELIANIHRGLRCFREYFGESDEVNIDVLLRLHFVLILNRFENVPKLIADFYTSAALDCFHSTVLSNLGIL